MEYVFRGSSVVAKVSTVSHPSKMSTVSKEHECAGVLQHDRLYGLLSNE